MKNIILTFIVTVVFATSLFSQGREGTIWYFGTYAGVDFNSGSPVALLDGQLQTQEGCATICDPNGNLLFYTDGSDVWNSLHVFMMNGQGLMGSSSSTQSAVIIPKPLNPNIYYIFTVDDNIGTDGLRYSTVNMNLAGGYGSVVSLNNMLFTPACEKITGVSHANGMDIWVITHQWSTMNFMTYLVTSNGVQSTTPVISSIGTLPSGNSANTRGYLKASPDGAKIALGIEGMDLYELYDFNNITGQLTNVMVLFPPASIGSFQDAYGVEFSSDGTKLYGSRRWGNPIFQWDLMAGSPALINASCTEVGNMSGGDGGALQLAYDGKIYVTRDDQMYLGVINFPNSLGTACNYVNNGFYLQGRHGDEGLPTFVASFFNVAEFDYQNTCIGDVTMFNITNTTLLDSAYWYFSDIPSGAANTSTLWTPGHIFTYPGDYDVYLITYRSGWPDTALQTITINPLPTIDLGNDTTICYGANVVLDAGNTGANYLWSTGATNQTINVSPNATSYYSVNVEEFGCENQDTILVNVYQVLADFTLSDLVCFNDDVTVTYVGNASPSATYDWNFYGANIVSGFNAGPYSVNWTNPGSYSVTLSITQDNCIIPAYTLQTYNPADLLTTVVGTDVLCHDGNDGAANLTVSGGTGNYTFSWSSGHNTEDVAGMAAGTYTVTITYDSVCTTTNSVVINEPPTSVEGNISIIGLLCHGDTDGSADLDVSGGIPPYTYSWNYNGETTQDIDNIGVGAYFVTINDNHACEYIASVVVNEPDSMSIISTPNFTMCLGETFIIGAQVIGGTSPYSYIWNDGAFPGDSIEVSPTEETIYEVYVVDDNACESPSSEVKISLFPKIDSYQYTSVDSICPGDSTAIYFEVEGGNGGPYSTYLDIGYEIKSPYIVTPEVTTTFTILSRDNCGSPVGISFITIVVMQVPGSDFDSDIKEGCQPLEVNFIDYSPNEGQTYVWYFGDNDDFGYSVAKNPFHFYENFGTYDVQLTVTSKFGCTETFRRNEMITVFEIPEARFSVDKERTSIIRPNIFFQNLTENIMYANWDFRDGNFSEEIDIEHSFTDTGRFEVQLIASTSDLCKDTIYMDVYIDDEFTFYAPTAFNLNSDLPGNKVFMPIGIGIDPDNFHMIIYDRWGEKIFETFNHNHPWDGKVKGGNVAPEGTYSWIVRYIDMRGIKQTEKGSVVLIR
ncbi:MAG: PKD domain-containing protein [Bacteroidetes bacterium]|nr:PKD domain-containing protein [Bacteroidota bacterium]MBT6685237.1 PKD domain-containing protein [Bacteroidota bacterium]MBT7144385.1 PKD domain-containing protein [Bacteroidota bacterium]MBT7492198.1 PKD domain-containing protein [Bacteroidota bacterium]